MNERIRELIAQCSFTVTDYSMGINSSYEDFDKELFAELLLKDCIELMEVKRRSAADTGAGEPLEYYDRMAAKEDAFEQAGDAIRIRFRVK